MLTRRLYVKVLGLLTVISMLAGLMVAGAMLPVLAVAGVTTNTTLTGFQSIPSQLQKPPLPQQTVILAADGTRLATLFYQDRVEVELSEIATIMQYAIVAIEDSRFYQHAGFDFRGTMRALVSTLTGSQVQGGSTITQQYVKNILMASAKTDAELAEATARTPNRKLRELRYALALERILTKQEVLNGYLNIAYFGAGSYGVEAASRRYFSKSASQLTLAEASLLAGLVQQPYGYDPLRNPEAAVGRRSVVLNRMAELGYITTSEAREVAAQPLSEILNPSDNRNGCTSSIAPFYCDYVVQVIRSSPAFGNTLAERDALLRQGGLTITTTLDVNAQRAAQKAVNKYIPPKDKSGKAAAITMVRPGTGDIIAMAQNRLWGTSGAGNTTYNYNVERSMGGTIGMQAGSTFKVFVLAAAIEQGMSAREVISAPPSRTFTNFKNCVDGATFPAYTARNSTGSGSFNMREATAYSVNTYFVELERRTGICRPAEIAEALGVRLGNGDSLARVPSLVLGSNEITPLMMANSYATFAAHGVYCEPRVITEVVDRYDNRLPIGIPTCNQVIDREVADGVTSMLREVIEGSLPGRTGGRMALGRNAAGKTGTTNDSAAVWFAGYTPDLAAAVWVGDPRGGFKYPMKDITINGVFYRQVFGSLLPGPIWKESMSAALKNTPASRWQLKLSPWTERSSPTTCVYDPTAVPDPGTGTPPCSTPSPSAEPTVEPTATDQPR
jgi:membrane peptidoglycan carboxypeptidase